MHNHIPLNRTIKKLAYAFNGMIFTLILVLSGTISLNAKDIPAKPNTLVNDYANILTGSEKQALEQKLLNYEDSTSTQIAIVIEQSLDGDDLFEYCQRLAEGWGIGVQGKNNGILIYVAIGDRKSRIHTGYGMEATITDALSTRIRTTQMNPAFKEGRFYDGLDAATTSIMKAASGEFVNDGDDKPMKGIPKGLIIIIVIIILLIFTSKGKGGRGMRGNRGFGGGSVFWGGTFGSGGFSSGGGGGFGGFGGGSFGGGGSGGSW